MTKGPTYPLSWLKGVVPYWLESVQLNWAEIAEVNGINIGVIEPKGLRTQLAKYQDGWDSVRGSPSCQALAILCHSFIAKPRPLSMKEKVEADLDRKKRQRILERIETSKTAEYLIA